jgi:tellurite resistance protein
LSRRIHKIRPDLAGTTTVELLEKVQTEALRLRAENKRLAAELSASKKRVASLEKKRLKPVKKAAAVAASDGETAPVEKKAGPKRQALGIGLARFLGSRKPVL